MRKKSIVIFLMLVNIVLSAFTACKPNSSNADAYAAVTYRNIKDVTDEEIADIEALQKKYDYLSYGMILGSEAFLNSNDEIDGFSALFCEWLSTLIGIPFVPEYVQYDDFFAKVDSCELDFTGDITPLGERQGKYFMSANIAVRPIKHFRIAGSEPLFEIEKQRQVKIGFLEGVSIMEDVIANLRPGSYEIYLYSDFGSIYNALESGEIDTFLSEGVTEGFFQKYGDIYSEEFFPLIFVPVSMASANPEFKSIISVVSKALKDGAIHYVNNLYIQGYEKYQKVAFLDMLNDEERAYLNSTETVPVAFQYFNYPIIFFDEYKKQWDGITVDLLNEVGRITGLSFDVVNSETTEMAELIGMLNDGTAHLFSDLIYSAEREPHYLWAETKLMADQYALLSKAECPNITLTEIPYARVALIKNTAHMEKFNTWFPDAANTIVCDTVEDAVLALQQDKADFIMVSKTKLILYVNYFEYSNLKLNYLFNHYYEAAFAFNKEQVILRSIVDKALSVIDIDLYVDQWMFKSYDYKAKVVAAQRSWSFGIALLVSLILVLILFVYYRTRNMAKADHYSYERFKIMLDSTPLCCQLWDSNLNKIECNKEALRLFDLESKQEFIERSHELYPTNQPDGTNSVEKANAYVSRCFKEGRVVFDWTYKMLDGTEMPANIVAVRVKYGNEYVVATYTRDLREAKAAEQKIMEGMEKQRDLEIQRQAAVASNDAKTRFLANMSHEIRTPMNAIIGMSDLLLSEDLNIRQHRYAEDIKISSKALLDIINDILDLSKIHSAKLILSPVHYDIKGLFENLNSMVGFLIKDKKLSFKMDLCDSMPACIYGDDVRLRQVILNLLSNAVKFTKVGSVVLSFRIQDSTMVIVVTDTGTGIPEKNISALFDAFEQADIRNNRYEEGTGLGLAISKALVELMGGHISVNSVYGQGSSFKIELPFVLGNVDLIKKEDGFSNIIYAPKAEILVVDDRETNLNVVCGLLHQCQIKADRALSGAVALDMISGKEYNLVFMDHMMPEMDGIETTKRLRDMGVKIPIIALTANAVYGARELLISAGMDDFLSKPIDKEELYRVLSAWLPADKIMNKEPLMVPVSEPPDNDEADKKFWEQVHNIKGLHAQTGLDIAGGQSDIYKNTLEIFLFEYEKSEKIMLDALAVKDLAKFCIEVHGMKGTLALLGASQLSATALRLEDASREKNIGYCEQNFKEFNDELRLFYHELKNVFDEYWKNKKTVVIEPNLQACLTRITEAISSMDISSVYEEIDLLNEMEISESLFDDIEKLKDALMIMNYDYAESIIKRLDNC
ncbi:MAG: ATP-binding protein [Lachnospiraceae bacterium]|nr:ATP-binding protein [Lachnospiraceae bacterium]